MRAIIRVVAVLMCVGQALADAGLVSQASRTAPSLRLPSVIGDHMVLQRGVAIPVWGWALPGESVSVKLTEHEAQALADDTGRWEVRLPKMQAGGPFEMTVVAADSRLVIADILIGEVWVCSGQSNMEMSVQGSQGGFEEVPKAQYPRMRLFTVEARVAAEPQEDCSGQWSLCSPETAANFSGVSYYFGREIHREVGVPVGLVLSALGGTPAEAWTSERTLRSTNDFRTILDAWDTMMTDYPAKKRAYDKQLRQWQKEAAKARAAGRPIPWEPNTPVGDPKHSYRAAGLYNGMIAPLVPYAIRGAIWYQGECNTGRAFRYRALFPAMITDWRQAWGQGPFPFYFVQLPNFMETQSEPGPSDWAELREAQLMTLSLENTGMAVTIDLGEADDIHPMNKIDVGLRLSRVALANTYAQAIPYSGPLYRAMRIQGERIIIEFDHADGGLAARGGSELKGFAIAGDDQIFHWAHADIEGDTVVVCSDKVPGPVAVRYAWANNPDCNLHSGAGLPASPFRTDDWPGVTRGKHY